MNDISTIITSLVVCGFWIAVPGILYLIFQEMRDIRKVQQARIVYETRPRDIFFREKGFSRTDTTEGSPPDHFTSDHFTPATQPTPAAQAEAGAEQPAPQQTLP